MDETDDNSGKKSPAHLESHLQCPQTFGKVNFEKKKTASSLPSWPAFVQSTRPVSYSGENRFAHHPQQKKKKQNKKKRFVKCDV